MQLHACVVCIIKHFPDVSFQIEREKADLSVQVIQLVERLEEAEGGAESQV